MADQSNVSINLTAQDNLTPTLTTVNQAILAFQQQIAAAGTSLTQLTPVLTQAQSQLQSFQQATQGAGAGMQQNIQAYAQAIQAVQTQVAALSQAHGQHQQAAQASTQSLNQLIATVPGLTTAIGTATGALAAFGVSLSLRSLVDFGQEIVQTGIKMQSLQLAFKGIGGSAETGAATFGFITRESQRLGLELLSTATTFRNFEAAAKGTSLAGQAARDIFTGFATAARGLGIQGADLTRVFFALDRMMQTQVINMRELRQLSMAMPGSMEAFAHAMGTTTAGLAEMTKTGTLLATEALPAVAREMTRLSAGIAGDIGTQASTALARLGNEVVLLKNRIAESGLLAAIKEIADEAARALEAGRKASEARTRDVGGVLPALPGNLRGVAPDIQARQRLIQQLQDQLNPSALGGMLGAAGIPDLGVTGPVTEEDRTRVRTRIRALLEEQRQAIEAFQKGLEAPSPSPIPAAGPLATTTSNIQKLLEEGRKKLADIDLDAQFIPSLTVAEDKFKAWQETLKAVREELAKLSEPLRQAALGTPTQAASPYRSLIARLATERGINPALIEALVAQESGNRPGITSPAGAMGLMQLMPGTSRQYGAAGREFDPESNLRAGIAYLADLLKQFSGDVVKALTAFNAGPAGRGIPQATGENATFARDVLRRMPQGLAGVLGQAGAQEEALRGAVEAGKPDPEALARTMATGRLINQAYEDEARAIERGVAQLQRLKAAYSETKEERAQDTAELLKARFPQDEAIQKEADQVIELANLREAYLASKESVQEFAQSGDLLGLSLTVEQQRLVDFRQKLEETLTVLRAPTEERTETRLRALAERQGVTIGPGEERLLGAITATERARAQAREMDQIATRLAGQMRQTFENLWEEVFTGGVTSFRQLGQVVVQSLQHMFAQLTAQIMSQLLNAMAGTTGEKGGWEGMLARGVVGLGVGLLGGGESPFGSDIPGMTNDPTVINDLQSQINLLGATHNALGNVFPHGLGAIQPLRLAAGGIVRTPSYATLAEMGQPEAVVPLPSGGRIPVQFSGQQSQQQQPIVIEIHNDYTGAVSPSALKTGKREIIQHVINDYRSDGPIRRTFRAG